MVPFWRTIELPHDDDDGDGQRDMELALRWLECRHADFMSIAGLFTRPDVASASVSRYLNEMYSILGRIEPDPMVLPSQSVASASASAEDSDHP